MATSNWIDEDFATLPLRFRAVLKDPNPAALAELDCWLDAFAHASREPCTLAQRIACELVAAEAAAVGSDLARSSLLRVKTMAQAASFTKRWLRWIRAMESLPGEVRCEARAAYGRAGLQGSLLPEGAGPSTGAAPTWDALLRPAYMCYDTRRFDFRGILLRIFADVIGACPGVKEELAATAGTAAAGTVRAHHASPGGRSPGCDAPDGRPLDDPLAQLHLTPTGARERGYARASALPRDELLRRDQTLDEATRYGCGALNRALKASPLYPDLLRLYRAFVREWVAPHLGATELLFQTRPIFRVMLPDHLAVGPRHRDCEYHAQPNELNFWRLPPLTHSLARQHAKPRFCNVKITPNPHTKSKYRHAPTRPRTRPRARLAYRSWPCTAPPQTRVCAGSAARHSLRPATDIGPPQPSSHRGDCALGRRRI